MHFFKEIFLTKQMVKIYNVNLHQHFNTMFILKKIKIR